MCVEDVVSNFTRCGGSIRKLGYFYGVLVTYIVFMKLEHTASGPLSMMTAIALDLLRDIMTAEELEVFRDGMSESVVVLMKCPLFHNRKTRVPLLYICTREIVVPGARLYASLIVPRLSREEIDVLRKFITMATPCNDVISRISYESARTLMPIDRILSRLGLVVCSHYVHIPAPNILARLLR